MANEEFVQMVGPFTARDEIVTAIKRKYGSDFYYIKKCGIQCEKAHVVRINGNDFEMGKTEILEFSNVRIQSLYFLQDEPATAIVDCILGY